MKKSIGKNSILTGCILFFLICLWAILLPCVSMALNEVLYDDFSGQYLDASKWMQLEQVLKVDDGKLISIFRGMNLMNSCYMSDPASVKSIQATITVLGGELPENGGWASAIINGTFYQSAYGNVHILLNIGLSSITGKLIAWYHWDDGEDNGNGTIPVDLEVNMPYVTKIEYDGINNFIATIKNTITNEVTTTNFSGPTRAGDALNNFIALTTGAGCPNNNCIGYISATFDDVYVNDTLYDNFNIAPINGNKWNTPEIVRIIESGKLDLSIQNSGQLPKTTNSIYLSEYQAKHVEASFTIKSNSFLSTGANGWIRVAGELYNESYGPGSGKDYNGYEGAVFACVALKMNDDRTLSVQYIAERSNDANWNNYTDFFIGDFSTKVKFDIPVLLGLTFDPVQKQLIFTCNDEKITYNIASPIYQTQYPNRRFQSRVNIKDTNQSGYIIANVDNVYIEQSLTEVKIDIKPGGYPNTINLKSKGKVAVGILSSETFDATSIDKSTVIFAGASVLTNGDRPQDLNGDGLLDVVLHFNTQDLTLKPGDIEACLTGRTFSGQEFKGCDSVNIVK